MPERKPNYVARVLAVLALVVAFVLVVLTLASSGGSDDGDDGDNGGSGDDTTQSSGPTNKGERAIDAGVWIVGEGDTLVSISEETGIDLDELVSLNSDIDPQTLSPGQRISLREGGPDESGSGGGASSGVDSGGDAGSGVGDAGPTGTGESDSGGDDTTTTN